MYVIKTHTISVVNSSAHGLAKRVEVWCNDNKIKADKIINVVSVTHENRDRSSQYISAIIIYKEEVKDET